VRSERVKITRERLNKILDVVVNTFGVDDSDYDDVVRENYSGRGMYDRECVGFVVAPREQAALGAAIALAYADEPEDSPEHGGAARLLANARVDSVAFDVIVYFPGVTLEETDGAD
jgi:hypothetical protein